MKNMPSPSHHAASRASRASTASTDRRSPLVALGVLLLVLSALAVPVTATGVLDLHTGWLTLLLAGVLTTGAGFEIENPTDPHR